MQNQKLPRSPTLENGRANGWALFTLTLPAQSRVLSPFIENGTPNFESGIDLGSPALKMCMERSHCERSFKKVSEFLASKISECRNLLMDALRIHQVDAIAFPYGGSSLATFANTHLKRDGGPNNFLKQGLWPEGSVLGDEAFARIAREKIWGCKGSKALLKKGSANWVATAQASSPSDDRVLL